MNYNDTVYMSMRFTDDINRIIKNAAIQQNPWRTSYTTR